MTAPVDIYNVATGLPIYGGKAAPPAYGVFDSITFTDSTDGPPSASQNGQVLVMEVHGSGGSNTVNGRQYRATVSGSMALPDGTLTGSTATQGYEAATVFGFSTVVAYSPSSIPGGYFVKLRPIDAWGKWPSGAVRESAHDGFLLADGKVHLISERRYDALLEWAKANLNVYQLNKLILTGGSMGGWGTISYGVPRYSRFAALYADRPRWRYGYNVSTVSVPVYADAMTSYNIGSEPSLAAEDGGKTYGAHRDMIAFINNPANKVRWIGWCIGRQDGYATFQDQLDAVAALRANKRGFAFYWNNGDHSTGSQLNQITQSYPFGTFRTDQGYPLFTEHSLDQDPNVDLVGGINIGLSFRNVIETASGWSCEVTNVLNACTVEVEPISETFKAAVAKQLVTIPAANTWVPVSFTA